MWGWDFTIVLCIKSGLVKEFFVIFREEVDSRAHTHTIYVRRVSIDKLFLCIESGTPTNIYN